MNKPFCLWATFNLQKPQQIYWHVFFIIYIVELILGHCFLYFPWLHSHARQGLTLRLMRSGRWMKMEHNLTWNTCTEIKDWDRCELIIDLAVVWHGQLVQLSFSNRRDYAFQTETCHLLGSAVSAEGEIATLGQQEESRLAYQWQFAERERERDTHTMVSHFRLFVNFMQSVLMGVLEYINKQKLSLHTLFPSTWESTAERTEQIKRKGGER